LGVAYCDEVFGAASAIALKSGMKPLERRRFIAARSTHGQEQRPLPLQEPVAKRARLTTFDDPDGDDVYEDFDDEFHMEG